MRPGHASFGPTVVSAAAVAPVLIWMLVSGPRWAGDTPTYAAWADALISVRFDVFEFLRSNTFTAPLVLYLGWIVTVALAKILAGGAWPWALLALNGVAVWWAVRTTVASVASQRAIAAAWVAGLWLAWSPDVWVFAPLVLGDLWFTALCTVVVAALMRWPAGSPAHIIAIAGLATITRPATAPLLVCGILVLSGTVRWSTRSTKWAVGLAAIAAITVVAAHAWVVTAPVWLPDTLLPWGERLRAHYARGVVVMERPDTFVAPALTISSAVALTLRKWAYFFSPWLPGYSGRHVAINLLWFVPLYAAIVLAVWRAPNRFMVHVLVLYVGLLSGFHALQELDFDQRYRIPALPAMVILAGLSVPWLSDAGAPTRLRRDDISRRVVDS
jgi:hypothetical protein